MRISDWSSDVCSSDLEEVQRPLDPKPLLVPEAAHGRARRQPQRHFGQQIAQVIGTARPLHRAPAPVPDRAKAHADAGAARYRPDDPRERSEEHTSELQSLMRISYAVFCLKKQIKQIKNTSALMTHNTHRTASQHRPLLSIIILI